MTAVRHHLLLTGPPGCGKTTVLLKAVDLLRESGCLAFGFTTPEVRRGRTRTGFALELLHGERETLASTDFPGPPRVGRYGVRLEAVDRLVLPEIERGLAAAQAGSDVILVMDEIGKMELFSQSFRQAVLRALEAPVRLLATIMAKPHPFADSLKGRADTRVIAVTRENRASLPREIALLLLGGA